MNIFRFYCLCTFIALCIWGGVASAQIVEIPDPNLRQAIRETLQLPDGVPITEQDMLRLTGFAAEVARIENITGLEYAHNLKSLYLRNNPIEDLTPIANPTQLELLHLIGVPMEDLAFLNRLTELRELYLAYCQITDITPIQNLTKLVLLDLAANRIVDINPLANLTALTDLRIESNQIVDVSPLANLTQLTNLTLANNAITDFRPLFGLNLQSVDIDIHKLQELASSEIEITDPNLERAIREEMGLPSEVPLTQLVMSQLTSLNAREKQITDLTGLEYATNVIHLNLGGNQISDLNPLSGLSQLQVLALWANRVNSVLDLSPLSNLTELRILDITDSKISDVTPLANLVKLESLALGNVSIEDISPLSNLTQLKRLGLTSNRIVDISPLANLTQLEELRLNRNHIVNVTPLANLTALQTLWIHHNGIVDFSPLQGLSPADFRYDEVCLIPSSPIQNRIENRNLPSIVQTWGDGTVNLSHLSRVERISYHDIYWTHLPFGLGFQRTPPWSQLAGDLESAIARRVELLAKNPNMIFLAEIRLRNAHLSQYPEDWFGWVRDGDGNPILGSRRLQSYLIDLRLPEVQDIIVQQAVAVSKCGLYDGIMFDWWGFNLWGEEVFYLVGFDEDGSIKYSEPADKRIGFLILQRLREAVPDDFLIIVNSNHYKAPLAVPYINGSFMESFYDEGGYTRSRIAEVEDTLLWFEQNAREPQITCLRGQGIPTEPPDSSNNRRWMRLFTTMSLTLSDGYVLYTTGQWYQEHFWFPFWDANLGQPIGTKTQRYQNVEGLYIRKFDNGWAVYNRSGNVQEISLPENATGMASGQTGKAHQLPDLDGEIYLKTVAGQPTSPYDLNMDGVVNVLDLILTAQNLGSTEGDINGDGITNILDLILVAQHLGETSTSAAPAALHVSLSPETVQKWIDMAHAQNDGSVIFAQGIAMLERLLALVIPDKTVLRANYPNPFNPETWIPYHLASETAVRISIYDLRGVLVRQFNLGHQKEGYYTDQRKAVYWDGRNEIGEPVSSGIYFYTLTTDDYTGTRRMVILK